MNTVPPAPDPQAVGAFVDGPPNDPRQPVRWSNQYRDHHELAAHVNPDREAYLSLYSYPPGPYCSHFKAAGYSPRGYAGPASCRFLLFDVDRAGDPDGALTDTRTLVTFLRRRYGTGIDTALAAYWSGGKGFHLTLELVPAWVPSAAVPATCKRLALTLAEQAGVRIDTAPYDHQRLVRLPNSRHRTSGLHKRFLTFDELLALDASRIRELARHPTAVPVPVCGATADALRDDWTRAATPAPIQPTPAPVQPTPAPTGAHPVVPKFVRDFIGFADVLDPGRAGTLFRAAAALAQHGTPEPVIAGLLEEPATKTGLPLAEVRRQIACGVLHGRRGGAPT